MENTINYQRNVIKSNTVPRKYAPRQLPRCHDNNINVKFNNDFKELFKAHLSAVITSNEISVEIKRAKLQSTFQTVEYILISSQDPSSELLDCFLKETNSNHTPSPTLRAKIEIEKSPAPPPSPQPQNITIGELLSEPFTTITTLGKRPTTRNHPKGKKTPRQYVPFLELNPCQEHHPI